MVHESNRRAGRAGGWSAAPAVGLVPLAVVVMTHRLWQGRLPDPLPTQWDASGVVSNTMTVSGFSTIMIMGTGAGGLLAVLAAVGAGMRWPVRRVLATVGAGVGAFGAALWLMIGSAALDRVDASSVPIPTWQIPAMLIGVAAWASISFVACGPAPARRLAAGRPSPDLPRIDLASRQPAEWDEASHAGVLPVALLLPLAGLAATLGIWISPWAASPVLLVAAVIVLLSTYRLRVDIRGLHVGFGRWGWPRLTVPLGEIESAEVTTVRPAEWGGWGYRMRPGGRGLILRSGPGLRLSLSESRQFVASARDPETAAGLINALIDREAAAGRRR